MGVGLGVRWGVGFGRWVLRRGGGGPLGGAASGRGGEREREWGCVDMYQNCWVCPLRGGMWCLRLRLVRGGVGAAWTGKGPGARVALVLWCGVPSCRQCR